MLFFIFIFLFFTKLVIVLSENCLFAVRERAEYMSVPSNANQCDERSLHI